MNVSKARTAVALTAGLLLIALSAGCAGNAATGKSALNRKQNTPGPAAKNMGGTNDAGQPVDLRTGGKKAVDYEMLIESEPSGAQIVIGGQPIAKTPCRVLVNGSQTGFFLTALSIKARFIATDTGGQSRTVEELFSRHDKIPETLHFSPDGAKRTLRDE